MDGAVGVRFAEAGPISYCSPGDLRVDLGDYVVVRTPRGERMGWVVLVPEQVVVADLEGPLRVIDRLAGEADVSAWRAQRERAEEDTGRAQAVAARSDDRVRVASLEYDLSGERLDITFTAPDRIEPERLRRAWAETFDADVAVERVGDRDRAKSAGGLGVCGLALCCSTWMTEFPAISMKMAKEQDLPPNPSKISGVCGRLLCCLTFEIDAYRELRGGLPKVGKRITTPAGRAKVLSIQTLQQRVRLRMEDSGEVVEIPADELRAQYGTAVRPAELEAEVEAAVHEQDRALRDQFLAALEPVGAPRGRPGGAAVAPPSPPAPPVEVPPTAPDDPDGSPDDADTPSRSGGTSGRRRGSRRGGRRRGGRDARSEGANAARGEATTGESGRRAPGTRTGKGPSGASQPGASQPGQAESGEGARRRRRGRRGGRRRRRGDGGDAGGGSGGGGTGGGDA